MKIVKNTVVTVEYTLMDAQNKVIEDGEEIVYLHGGYGNTLPAIERALDEQDVGFSITIQVEPEEAFGAYDPMLLKIEPRDKFPSPLEVGMQFEGIPSSDDEDEQSDAEIYTVTDIVDDRVILDANHPLAGMALRFSLHVTDVRPATENEIEHGHPHGMFEDDEDEDFEDCAYRSIQLQ